MKLEMVRSKLYGKLMFLSADKNKAIISTSANGTYYIHLDHLREPLQLKRGVLLIEALQIVQNEWLKLNERLSKIKLK